jgi:hypothetical protein
LIDEDTQIIRPAAFYNLNLSNYTFEIPDATTYIYSGGLYFSKGSLKNPLKGKDNLIYA